MFDDGQLAIPFISTIGLMTTNFPKRGNTISYKKSEYDANIEVGNSYYVRRIIKWRNPTRQDDPVSRVRHIYNYGKVVSYHKETNILTIDTTVSAGIFPNLIRIDNMDGLMANLVWHGKRVGPMMIEFDPLNPYVNDRRSIYFENGNPIHWTMMLDSKYNFYEFEFFKNDIDKIDFLSRGWKHGVFANGIGLNKLNA